jgi:UDP-N-acetyl-2-amino-2-deoxyglucuronate dehydrogenase
MNRQWRCGVVGMGVIGDWHARVLPKLQGCTFAAVCDVVPGRGEEKLAKLQITGPKVYTDIDSMLANEQLDVVHICTPSGNHLEPAVAAMKAGVNVICEKPMEITEDRIDQMIAAARQHNVRLAGIFQNRWHPANRAIRAAIDAGRFGTIAYAGCYTPWFRTDEYYREGGWRGTWKLDGGGAMMNQAIHQVDMLQWFAGPVKQVSAYASSRIHKEIEVEDTLVCSLQFQSGAYGTIFGSTAMFPGQPVRIEIGGEHGSAVMSAGLRFFKFRDESDADAKTLEEANSFGTTGGQSQVDLGVELHKRNITHILDSWQRNEDAMTHGPEARKAVAIIRAMYQSAKQNGAPVQLR